MSALHDEWKAQQARPIALRADEQRCDGRMVSRPNGFGTTTVGQLTCVNCLRRTAPRGITQRLTFITPPQFVSGQCPRRIAP